MAASFMKPCDILDNNLIYQSIPCIKTVPFTSTSSTVTIAPAGRSIGFTYNKLLSTAFGKAGITNTAFRYEHISVDQPGPDIDADIYGGTLDYSKTITSDANSITLGVFIPYDYFNYGHSILDNINQLGVILYGIYNMPVMNNEYQVSILGTTSYYYDDLEYNVKSKDYDYLDEKLNTFGLGTGLSFSKVTGQVRPALFTSFQYSHSDGTTNDYYLLNAGLSVDVSLTSQVNLTVFGSWTLDLTNYDPPKNWHGDLGDDFDNDDYWKVGVEAGYNFGGGWSLNVGYRKILGLTDFNSDKVYIGVGFKF